MDDGSDERDERDKSGEELIDESGRNPTQRRMDETGESEEDEPVDAPWGTGEDESM